jgi:adenosylhomocysteine nucleosidase
MTRRSIGLLIALLLGEPCAVSGEAPRTAILGAMGSEVNLLVAELEDAKDHEIEGIFFWEGRLRGRRVVVARTGVGKVNAAITATLLYVHFRPAEVLFTGIAGGLRPGLLPGDIVIAAKTVQHDFGTLTSGRFHRRGARNPISPERNPVFLPADRRLLRAALAAAKTVKLDAIRMRKGARTPDIVEGTVATGDVFVASPAKKAELHRELGADAVEMEGAAVAQVCWQWRVPCLVIRSVSDLADDNALADARTFLRIAAANSAALVTEIVAGLAVAPAEP